MSRRHVNIWVDGSSTGRVGSGGLAAIVDDGRQRRRLYVSLGFPHSVTNNMMELLAAYAGLRAVVRPERTLSVTVHSDSEYVVLGVARIPTWELRGWRRVKNVDLWRAFQAAYARVESLAPYDAVGFEWVKGHNGTELNEEADRLAGRARALAEASGTVAGALGPLFEEPLAKIEPMPAAELLRYVPHGLREARSARKNVAGGRY